MRGFTLIEMLIAIAIIGVMGAAISTAVGGVANQTRGLEQRTVASWIASNHLARMRILQRRDAQPLAEGTKQTRLVFADREWEVETEIKTTDHPWVRRVEVSVFEATDDDGRQGPYGQLSGFLGQY
ncbi:MAG: type II secretion system minor pseudopilin GspI [Proteobacteria bacterium]|jgi:general secretion pathway protein I|nr:type II secretion system minor pseudopilin GspI [Pseudomonadota bacterium]